MRIILNARWEKNSCIPKYGQTSVYCFKYKVIINIYRCGFNVKERLEFTARSLNTIMYQMCITASTNQKTIQFFLQTTK